MLVTAVVVFVTVVIKVVVSIVLIEVTTKPPPTTPGHILIPFSPLQLYRLAHHTSPPFSVEA